MGLLLEILLKFLMVLIKVVIFSVLCDEVNGEKVEKFVRVKVMSYYLDVSGWMFMMV